MLARETPIAWRTLRPYIAHELEPGRAPERDPKPWLNPAQMALAQQVLKNAIARGKRGIRDRTGERHGRLVVLGIARMSGRTSTWRCQCDCGATKVVSSGNLSARNTRSCGCLRREVSMANARRIQPLAAAARRKRVA